MKKLFVLILTLVMCVGLFAGCGNMDIVDTVYTFDRAIISMPDGTIVSGKVDSWSDYEGDQLQVEINGVIYLTHATNVVLIAE